MNALEKNIAVARGEAMAASLLATAALQAVLAIASSRQQILEQISDSIDRTLNMSGPAKGDANDEPNTMMREVARFQAMQHLDAIATMIRNQPPKE